MMLDVRNLKKRFGSKPVLNEVSLTVKPGEIFSLIGPNGAGKTTTLRCIYGDLRPDGGEIKLFGERFHPKQKEKIAVMTEDRLNFRRFRGEDYPRLWSMLYPNWNEKIFSSFVMHYNFDLKERVESYSTGMRTLLNLALDMASGADLLILDEPTQNLDPIIRQEALNILKDFSHQEGKTMIISSHEIYELEEISSSFGIIREGTVLYTDTIDDAKAKHRLISRGEKNPNGEIIGMVDEDLLVKTEEDIGRYPTFKEITLGYLQGKKGFMPFRKNDIAFH